MNKRPVLFLSISLLVVFSCFSQAPNYESIEDISINDYTATLSAEDVRLLKTKLTDFNNNTGSQIAVMMISTIPENETLESKALSIAEALGVGRKEIDDGVLLLIVKDDRLVRIEVGYGLEGSITDVAAIRIIREYMVPKFRQEDFVGGISSAINGLMLLILNERLPTPKPIEGEGTQTLADAPFLPMIIVIIGAPFLAMFVKRWWYWLITSAIVIIYWLMFHPLVPSVAIAFFLIGKLLSLVPGSGPSSSYKSVSLGSSGTNTGSSYGGSGNSTSSGSGGGFSGGGGGFGGGGASGSW